MKFLKSAKVKVLDGVICFVLMALAFLPLVIFADTNAAPTEAQVKVHGQVVKTLNLSENQKWTYENDGNINKIQIQNRRVRVYYANCKNQIDVDAGWISKSGQTLVCLPHGLVITLTGKGPLKQDGKVVDYQ